VTGDPLTLITTTGTAPSVAAWAAQANPTVDAIRRDGAAVAAAVTIDDSYAIASAATQLCTDFGRVPGLPANPDAVAAQAWSTAITSYAKGVNDALKAAAGDKAALQSAANELNQGEVQLSVVSARELTAP
jgi:hypothetical protein